MIYGNNGTIHGTQLLDIEVDTNGASGCVGFVVAPYPVK